MIDGASEQEQRRGIASALERADLTLEQLWVRFFALGGDVGLVEVEAYLYGLMVLPAGQRDTLAHALNERLAELAPAASAPYSRTLRQAKPQRGPLAALVDLQRARFTPPEDLPVIAAAAGQALGTAVAVYLVDDAQRQLTPLSPDLAGEREPLAVDSTLAGQAFRHQEVLPSTIDGRSRLWVPLLDGAERLGVLEVEVEHSTDMYDSRLREQLGWVAAQLGSLVTSLSEYGDALQAARLRTQRSPAGELIWSLPPPQAAETTSVSVAGLLQPSSGRGGDTFDYALSTERVSLSLFDAKDPGLAAGLMASAALAASRTARRDGGNLHDQARAVDEVLAAQFPGGRVTGVLADLDLDAGRLQYLAAGHPQPLLVRDGRVLTTLTAGRRPSFGVPGAELPLGEERLAPGDWLLMCTDGVTEGRDPAGDPFGEPRLVHFLEREAATSRPTAEVVRRLLHAVLDHQDGRSQDDATVLLARWKEDLDGPPSGRRRTRERPLSDQPAEPPDRTEPAGESPAQFHDTDASPPEPSVVQDDTDQSGPRTAAAHTFPSGGRGEGLPVDEAELSAVLNEFATALTGDFSAADILRQLAIAATRVLHLEGAGVVSPDPDGELLRLVFSTRGRVRDIEHMQEVLQDGVCRDAHAGGQVINLADLAVEGAWPEYQSAAVAAGLHAVCAVPLRARHRRWGVLDLYRAAPMPLSAAELAAATMVANLATSCLVVAADRDTARNAQTELAARAMHDTLTGLPVRWVFLEQLAHALSRLNRRRAQVGVLFLDLDGLKYVNDTYGHLAGDRLIVTAVARIRAALRPADLLARIGGDEFVVLLEDIASSQDAVGVARRVLDHLAAPYRPDGHTIQPSASIGIALADSPGTNPAALISHADAAMYRAKHSGGARCELFDPRAYAADRANVAVREQLAGELRVALHDGQLAVHYQPIIDLTDASPTGARLPAGGVHAVEALLRWHHPERGLLSATAFVDTAERAGLLPEIGAWMLRTACRQLAAWDQQLGPASPRRLFVNVSASELGDAELPARVRDATQQAGLRTDRVTVEITETGLFTDPLAARDTLAALRDLGCHLAIDDFGTGYSSLSRLIDIPADTIKVDQAFTRDLHTHAGARAVITAVLTLGTTLHRTVVVEGVEDEDSLTELRVLGATHVQGYHLGRPVAPENLMARLAAHVSPVAPSR